MRSINDKENMIYKSSNLNKNEYKTNKTLVKNNFKQNYAFRFDNLTS